MKYMETIETLREQRDGARKTIREMELGIVKLFRDFATKSWNPDNFNELIDLLDLQYPELK